MGQLDRQLDALPHWDPEQIHQDFANLRLIFEQTLVDQDEMLPGLQAAEGLLS